MHCAEQSSETAKNHSPAAVRPHSSTPLPPYCRRGGMPCAQQLRECVYYRYPIILSTSYLHHSSTCNSAQERLAPIRHPWFRPPLLSSALSRSSSSRNVKVRGEFQRLTLIVWRQFNEWWTGTKQCQWRRRKKR